MAFDGRLQQWNEARGFGFIEVEATRERVFVHASALPHDGTRPATGARLTFDIERDAQGRKRAVHVRLADARNAVAMTPRAEAPAASRSTPHPRMRRRGGRAPAWAVVAMVAVVAAVGWRAQTAHRLSAAPAQGAPQRPVVDADAAARTCDGRTHCSQMRSCDEATWFLQHCPGVEMDGNHDGVPCEQQWCGPR
jgi:cold shock CspA family protein